MRLERRTRYALRMMVDLAEHSKDGGSVGIRAIAERQEIARRYLEQIAGDLRKAGLLVSKRGQSGGYSLAKPASAIAVEEIVEAVSGPVLELECLGESTTCERIASCKAWRMWSLIDSLVRSVLREYHLDDLVDSQAIGRPSGDDG